MMGFSLGLPYRLSVPSHCMCGTQEAHLLPWVGAQPHPAGFGLLWASQALNCRWLGTLRAEENLSC